MAKFAVVKLNNAQFKVSEGDVIEVDRLKGEAGTKVEFDAVLLLADGDKVEIGKPALDKIKVSGEITEQTKGEKVQSATYKAKARTRRKVGSRPMLTKIKITKIA